MAFDLQEMTESLETKLDQLTTHKTFLKAVGIALNANVYRKRWARRLFEKTLISLELPLRSDQARLLALVQELQDKIDSLEASNMKTSALDNAKTPEFSSAKMTGTGSSGVESINEKSFGTKTRRIKKREFRSIHSEQILNVES